jgi:hypothetical protein
MEAESDEVKYILTGTLVTQNNTIVLEELVLK